jgi:hypothetical protein
MPQNIDLSSVFQTVTQQLSQKQNDLNEADSYNHDHGDHMVQIFDLIENAVSKQSNKSPSDQLAFASKVVEETAHSGSAKLYAQGLSNAAKNLSGKDLTHESIGLLVKGLMNVEEPQQTSQPKENSGAFLGTLLSSFTGQGSENKTDQQISVDDLLRAGLSFYQSKQNGDTNTQAVMEALMAASPLGQSAHRSQSGALIAETIMGFAKNFGR